MSLRFPNHSLMSTYLYNTPMEIIWKIVKDTSLLNNILSSLKQNFASEPVLLNSKNTYEKNASFFFYINKQYKLLYKVIELIETDYYCKITCKIISSINKDQFLFKSVHLHHFGPHSTYLIYERSCHLPDVSKEEREKMKRNEEVTSTNFLSYIEHSIKNNFHLKTQLEGRKFRTNVNNLIKELYNFEQNSFLSLNGYRCNQLPIVPGVSVTSEFKNKNYPDRSFRLRMTIESIHCNSRGLNAKLNILDKEEKPNKSNYNGSSNDANKNGITIPDRFMIIDIIMINHEETYYALRHYFHESASKKVLKFVSQNKLQFFNKLFHFLEKKVFH